MPSLIYRSALAYELLIRALYGRYYDAHYRAIAELIPAGSRVVEVCCGPATLYRHYLRGKSVDYTGIDLSEPFITALCSLGGRGIVSDAASDASLPEADYVILQGALYFFLPDPTSIIDRMLLAARKQVIVSEAIKNIANSRWPIVNALARRLAGAVAGEGVVRFTERTLDQLFERYRDCVIDAFKIPGGRDKVYVLDKKSRVPK